MKIAAFRWNSVPHLGIADDTEGVIRCFDTPDESAQETGVAALIGRPLPDVRQDLELADVELLAPLPCPQRNIFCVGINYRDHIKEFAASGFDKSTAKSDVPQAPIVFSKVPQSVIAPQAPIRIDKEVSTAIDYEVELAVIIGKAGRSIPAETALEHVWGYTIINDVTARDLQSAHSQWLIGKSQDSFCPMGPWAVLRDALDLADTQVRSFVNDELRQDSNTGFLIFSVEEIIAAISNGITLLPGDVIATGTPAGVGIGFNPPRFLAAGDRVKMVIDGIGTLENPVEVW